MKSEEPEESFVWPPKAKLTYVHRVGPKCIVKWIPAEDGFWWEIGGKLLEENEPDADDSQEVDTIYGDEDETLHTFDDSHIAQEGGVGIDKRQSRIYYRFNTRTQKHECIILLPSDFHFRNRKKGVGKEGSKSFMKDGSPRPEVLLLYALKTQKLMDRRIAVEAFPASIWDARTFGELFSDMDHASRTHPNFCKFASGWLLRAATRPGGLADWATWQEVADAAFETKNEKDLHLANPKNQNTHVQFLRALAEAVEENQGIPSQSHVRKKCKWDYNDFWKGLLNTMDMAWLPSKRVWDEFQKQLKDDGQHHEEQPHEEIDKRKAKSPKTRR